MRNYEELINASGGHSSSGKGDHPQPLSEEDERALDKAWEKTRFSIYNEGEIVAYAELGEDGKIRFYRKEKENE